MKKFKKLRIAGYVIAIMELLVLLFYLATLLGSPTGAFAIIPILLSIPFLLLGVAGGYLIGRIQFLPSIYLFISGVIACIVFGVTAKSEIVFFPVIVGTLGVVSGVAFMLLALLALFICRGYGNRNKKLIIAGLVAAGVLLLAATVFLFLVSRILLPHEGVDSAPLSTLPGALSAFLSMPSLSF